MKPYFPKREVAVEGAEIQLLMDYYAEEHQPDDFQHHVHDPNPANASQGFEFYWGSSYTYDQTFYVWNWTFFHIVDTELGWDNEHLEYETVIDEKFCYSEYKFRCYFERMKTNLREFDEHFRFDRKSADEHLMLMTLKKSKMM